MKEAIVGVALLSLGILAVMQSNQAPPTKDSKKTESTNIPSMSTNNEVTVRFLNEKGELGAPTRVAKVVKTDAEWKTLLTEKITSYEKINQTHMSQDSNNQKCR